jgi:hypothetical protein
MRGRVLFFARPTPIALAAGACVSVWGWRFARGRQDISERNAQLATSGPYAFTRNPLYFGSFLLGLGFTIASGRWVLAVLFAALFIGIYLPVMRVEASTMAQLFGNEFESYRRSVPLFFPRLTPYRQDAAPVRFDGALYLRYREYRAALGLIIAWGLLLIKTLYL